MSDENDCRNAADFKSKIEEWRPITGWMHYEVSDHGRVRSLDRLIRCARNPNKTQKHKGRILKLYRNPVNGYLYAANGFNEKCAVHKLVAAAFIENPRKCCEVNHINGIKSDNTKSNLEWCTRSENCVHKSRVLGIGIGITHGSCKLSETQVNLVRSMHENGSCKNEIMKMIPTSRQNIYRIITRKSWNHI